MTRSSWSDASTWADDGLRREVFFFRGGGTELYGSLFAAVEPSRPLGLVACASWGVEADRTDPLLRSVALSAARLGGAALIFHYPGYGDSFGDLADARLDDLSATATAAVEEASRRCPGLSWILAGFMLGASVACLAARPSAAEGLLLVQPALRPSAYFERLAKDRRSLSPGTGPSLEMMEPGSASGMAYGYPVPRRIVECAADADRAVEAALAAFGGGGAIVRHERPKVSPPLPPDIEQLVVRGAWRFGSQNNPDLASAATDWLDRRMQEECP
jgi:alpha/beta superfamily hydrolase